MLTKLDLIKNYKKIFKNNPEHVYYSPGRVNLIGEHIDYHGGLVLPAALSLGTYGAVSFREDDIIRVYSAGYSAESVDFTLFDLAPVTTDTWTNYIRGVLTVLHKEGYHVKTGFNLYIESTMPTSAGLSSSASLELLLLNILNDYFHFTLSKTELALLGKKVENEYLGLLSGIMDQFVIAHGQKDYALLLNTNSLAFDYIPLDFIDHTLVIVNTNKKRGLTDSKYNERYHETMAALTLLQNFFPHTYLASFDESYLPAIEKILDPLSFRRVRHVIREQSRTIKSAHALKMGDLITFSQALNASHASLRDDYEVTGVELDTLVSLLLEAGASGARMTGAGFGGCAIALVPTEKMNTLTSFVSHHYREKIGYFPTFFTTTIEDGTKEI